ncbi:MAG: hypothetical protein GC178_11755 [Flavobacteriales bacterium]|nr:hypothetical protein [Flavobacteriales bacterium]
MKKLLFTILATICFSGVFAQEKSVAIVRHINWLGIKKTSEQRLIVSKPGESGKVIELEQRYLDTGMNEAIMSDNQKVIEVFTELIKEGYELESSTSSTFAVASSGNIYSGGSPTGGREIIYIFVKD